jgi:geranylgeranyl diphosphate synthase type I
VKQLSGLEYHQPLAEVLREFFDELEASLPPLSTKGQWALDTLKEYSLRPSKRIRGSIAAMLVDTAKGVKNDPAGLRLGAAIELIQNHLLIVDDVMDGSTTRRGEATVHIAYERDFPYARGREAEMVGILVGMIAQHASSLLLLGAKAPAENKQAALAILERSTLITDIGQIDDLDQRLGRDVSTDALLQKYAQKSSYYTFVSPIEAALALVYGVQPWHRKDAEDYGLPAGVAFQLRDDYLGIYGDTSKTGKPNLDDIHEGKYTLMVHLALQAADEPTKKAIQAIVGDHSATEKELHKLRLLLEQTGGKNGALQKGQQYAEEAKAAAHAASSWGSAEAAILESILTFAMEREN